MNLVTYLSEIDDFRRPQGQRYGKVAMLLIIIMAMMRNKYCYREIGRFCKFNKDILIETFGFKNGKVPSHVSIRTFIIQTDFNSVQQAFHKWASHYVPIDKNEWVHVDGKSIRSTVSEYSSQYQNFVSLVSLFASKREQVLHIEKMENKQKSESKVVEELLNMLDLKGVILTLDALHCKKNATQNRKKS